MSVVVITDDTTADELREAITHANAAAMRMPAHWRERKGSIHSKINSMLDDLEAAEVEAST
ncbi:MAG: hypothetical protein H0X12_04985 [Nocardioides sp.]|nr:hypothetical protein [Nocardioides sp.]